MVSQRNNSSWTDYVVPIGAPVGILLAAGSIGYGVAVGNQIKFDLANPQPDVISHAAFESNCKSMPPSTPDKILALCESDSENPQNVTRVAFQEACQEMPSDSTHAGIQEMKEFCDFNDDVLKGHNIDATAIINSMPIQQPTVLTNG